jgi:sterol desaturase/sphingolipid hydroxylase (fatty acid hydroxylase superfamily)
MMPSEMPFPNREPDAQMRSSVYSEPRDKPEPIAVRILKDRLVGALVSLVMLVFLAGLTFGAANVLHMESIGCVAVLAVICFAIVTINIVLFLSGSHLNRLHEQPPS